MDKQADYLRVCEEAVRGGGQVVQQWAGRFEVRKKGPADLVTQADFASQEAVRQIVLGAFPDHSFLGEESGSNANPGDSLGSAARAEFRWIVDPLDGTTNYVHGVPHYCVSLALERSGRLLVGAVYDPVLDECFTAAVGQGARLNGRPIHASRVAELSEALDAVGFPPNVQADAPDLLLFLEMLTRCQAIRRTGSSALNLCYLAAGRFDLYWSYSTHVWDVAAGVLIVREAGGCVTSPSGDEFALEAAHFLAAANPALHARLREVAARIVTGALPNAARLSGATGGSSTRASTLPDKPAAAPNPTP
jgi:myo-inositol-1(or 4)-monophosphatase